MMKISICASDLKQVIYSEHSTMNSTYRLMKEYRNRLKSEGFKSIDSRTLPKDWVLEQLKNDFNFSENEIEQINMRLESLEKKSE